MSSHPSVLIADDNEHLCNALKRYLDARDVSVRTAMSVSAAMKCLEGEACDLLLADYYLGDDTGDALVRWALEHGRARSAYCMSGSATPRNVVSAMRAGCIDVLEKPFELSALDAIIQPFLPRDPAELSAWRQSYAPDIIGEHPALLDELELVRSVADTDTTVLIYGETGTGKELVARAIHNASPRASRPFVAVNCAAIPESLIEDELFGHAKGAYTGALGVREGRILSANGGTLFLDEIGDMPLAAQAKLLRVLEERSVMPLGSDAPIAFDARIVAATNRDLEAMVEGGTFRADLLFRLSVMTVNLPPLRDRASDIQLLVDHFIARANRATGRAVVGVDAEAKRLLAENTWPGNVRALCNVVERAVVLKRSGVIGARELGIKCKPREGREGRVASVPAAPASPAPDPPASLNLREAIDRMEREMIGLALEKSGGNRTEAAALLGLNRTTLVEKLRKSSAS